MDTDKHLAATFNPQELNQALVCILCFGYYRSAHTVKECMHSFCKSCIYKHFVENMDCPHCGKDLQPFPFSMIRPDPVLQSIVDKLFPEVIEADYEEERQFYVKRNLPLPDHLLHRVSALNRSSGDLDTSITAMSEMESEPMSEPISLNTSLMATDPPTTNPAKTATSPVPDTTPSDEAPTESKEDNAAALAALDQQINAIVDGGATTGDETKEQEAAPEPTPTVESAPESSENRMDVSEPTPP